MLSASALCENEFAAILSIPPERSLPTENDF
jgi:hypothetical protein